MADGRQDRGVTATTPSDPTALPLEQKAQLLSGQDFWSTPPVEAA